MNVKIKTFLAAFLVVLTIALPVKTVQASTEEVQQLVKHAIEYTIVYHFNTAYAKIKEMPETNEKYQSLNELTPIQGMVWTDEINKSLAMITDMEKTGSAKTYDEVVNYVSNSKLSEWDRGYLLGELTG